jgi:hypothetical protein
MVTLFLTVGWRFPVYSGAMVDEESLADFRSRMNLDSGKETVELGQNSRRDRQPLLIHEMGHPVHQKGMQPGIAGQGLDNVRGSRIALLDRLDIVLDRVQRMPEFSLPIKPSAHGSGACQCRCGFSQNSHNSGC